MSSKNFFDDAQSEDFNYSDDGDNSRASEAVVEKLSRKESRNVTGCRCVVLFLILACCAILSTTSYIFLRDKEESEVIDRFDQFVETIGEITSFEMANLKRVSEGLAETFTATSMSQKISFPYVTPPNFEIAAKNARDQSGVEFYFYIPFVKDHAAWIKYANENIGWVKESREILVADGTVPYSTLDIVDAPLQDWIWIPNAAGDYQPIPVPGNGPYAPVWMSSPPPFYPGGFCNIDAFFYRVISSVLPAMSIAKDGVLTDMSSMIDLGISGITEEQHAAFHSQYVERLNGENWYEHPHSLFAQPVFNNIEKSEIVGALYGLVAWDSYMADLLPKDVRGIYAVLKNNCGQSKTYVINGEKADYLGDGELIENDFKYTERIVPLGQYLKPGTEDMAGHCAYKLYVYSSAEFENASTNRLAITFAICISAIFGIMTVAFLFYDRFVRKRNDLVLKTAAKSDAILSSLFPSNVRDRLFAEREEEEAKKAKGKKVRDGKPVPKSRLKNYLSSGDFSDHEDDPGNNKREESLAFKTKPIADLFTDTTIMFGDIAGFTAWSSVREPSQVFTLLETLYHAFDEIARRRRVFKVETVGDCYVAVTGLPDPQKDHAVIACRFARDCMLKTRMLTKKLEVMLGPDTGDLAMRIGLHSGPVTAGVLRGERSRFQLFGDTMNTASRMESNGIPDKIQISQETADLLIAAGKPEWCTQREDKIVAKGKGELTTYWLKVGMNHAGPSSITPSSVLGSDEMESSGLDAAALESARDIFDGKTTRLIDWNVDVLVRLLKQILAHRQSSAKTMGSKPNEARYQNRSTTVMDEVKEIIVLPEFDSAAALSEELSEEIELHDEVVEQLHDYVCNIAAIYRDNPFHSFEHASHVTMSVTKLLSRIVAPSEFDFGENAVNKSGKQKIASTLHDHTYGITSDPLTQFSCVFSALIHDVDHTGVPNAQLVKENTSIAAYYKGKSVAEQNSVDLAWDLLMDENYDELRAVIYTTDEELERFRQLVVNSVMATDIVDKELKTLRNSRWDRAFSESAIQVDPLEDKNRKATIVIEHLIQASDIAHTMQHWHIYRKWNERFFVECYEGYLNGRAEKDPAETWYQGELGFYDFYIIPLAKKLKNCGVFGVSSDEYLNYAEKNRAEWEIRGKEIVDEMIESVLKTGKSKKLDLQRDPVLIDSPKKSENTSRLA